MSNNLIYNELNMEFSLNCVYKSSNNRVLWVRIFYAKDNQSFTALSTFADQKSPMCFEKWIAPPQNEPNAVSWSLTDTLKNQDPSASLSTFVGNGLIDSGSAPGSNIVPLRSNWTSTPIQNLILVIEKRT
jgi:hypothetical protein